MKQKFKPFLHCSDFAYYKDHWWCFVGLAVKTNTYSKKYKVFTYKWLKKVTVKVPNKHYKIQHLCLQLYLYPAINKLIKSRLQEE